MPSRLGQTNGVVLLEKADGGYVRRSGQNAIQQTLNEEVASQNPPSDRQLLLLEWLVFPVHLFPSSHRPSTP